MDLALLLRWATPRDGTWHTPEDGSSIGNQAMLALLRERIPDLQEEDYIAARDELIDAGSLGRGRGRGGSIHRIAEYPENEGDDDAEDDAFGFQIYYMWAGSRRRYVPDFLVRLAGGTILALEIKGTDSPQNKAKRDALNEWVKAINAAGGFGRWAWDVAFKPGEVQDTIDRHAGALEPASS